MSSLLTSNGVCRVPLLDQSAWIGILILISASCVVVAKSQISLNLGFSLYKLGINNIYHCKL